MPAHTMPDPFTCAASILTGSHTKRKRTHHTRREKSPSRRPSVTRNKTNQAAQSTCDPSSLVPTSFNLDRTLPKRDTVLVAQVLDHGLAKSTKLNYESGLKAYTEFCTSRQINNNLAFPASEATILGFAASMASQKAASSISGMISGLRMWHILHNAPWPTIPCMKIFLKGLAAMAPPSSRRDPRPPVTATMLARLHQSLSLDSPRDAAIFAVACTIFWGQCRSGEVLGSSRAFHTPRRYPSRSSLLEPFSANGSRELTLPCTKTRQHLGDRVSILRQIGREDPIWALQNHFYVNRDVPASFHLFGYMKMVHGRASPRCLTKEEFLLRCNEIWGSHGLPKITGHSFRIGGTTELLLRGVDPEIVKRMGRWSSDAHMRYWRKTNEIAAAQAECLPTHTAPTAPSASARHRGRGCSRQTRAPRPKGAPY
ncbi:Reverse transcriptase domain protein [Ceratobasidium sp. AG-Ba]|nr:Reverse transcriptase domain protein [Ceratobasidium sp. AG-Ba]QRW14257.1 Reverse transcriptase domain protein [Ceratobasidium sp. AG-Ba]